MGVKPDCCAPLRPASSPTSQPGLSEALSPPAGGTAANDDVASFHGEVGTDADAEEEMTELEGKLVELNGMLQEAMRSRDTAQIRKLMAVRAALQAGKDTGGASGGTSQN